MFTTEFLRTYIPKSWRGLLLKLRMLPKCIYAACYDTSAYIRYSFVHNHGKSAVQLRASIAFRYHGIEKGLSFAQPRPGFGAGAALQLLANMQKYIERYGNHEILEVATGVLGSYCDFNLAHNRLDARVLKEYEDFRRELGAIADDLEYQGTLRVSRENLQSAGQLDLTEFFRSRYSIREFGEEPIALGLIMRAVGMAQKTPSVCNRQSARVSVCASQLSIDTALLLQQGNPGFDGKAQYVLIISSDLQCFSDYKERYQAWIDGGMYAMSLVYALHSLGVGTCCLNWSVEPKRDRELKRQLKIPNSRRVIMLIAVGSLAKEFLVAQSHRASAESVVNVL